MVTIVNCSAQLRKRLTTNGKGEKRLLSFGKTLLLIVWFHFFPVVSAVAQDLNNPTGDTPPSSPTTIQPIDPCKEGEPVLCEIDSDVGSSPGSLQPSSGVGNPINLMGGNKFQSETDFSLNGSSLMFNRMYNSRSSHSDVGLGMGWRHSYAVSIVDVGDGQREIIQSNGARIHFQVNGADDDGNPVLRSSRSNHGFLIQQDNRHQWHLPDGRKMLFQGSFLVQIEWPDQRRLKMFYRSKRLESVTDETGRVLQFVYSARRSSGLDTFEDTRFGSSQGKLESVILPDGSAIGYDYDDKRNLSRVRFPDGATREYHYEDETYPNHLTGLTDRTGVRFATWSYDAYGRAISSEYANGLEKVTLQHPDKAASDEGQMVKTVVTNSLGYESVFTWQRPAAYAAPLLLSSEGAGCATCPPTGFLYTYDANGRLLESAKTSLGNARGQDSRTYSYDDQGRVVEIRRVDVSGNDSLVERREYDDRFSLLPARTLFASVNPNADREIEIKRNSDGLPLQVVERGWAPLGTDLADSSGLGYEPIERITTLNYDELGKLVNIDGPRTDVDDITHFIYDELQRLKRIERADSPATHLREVDAFGRVTSFQIGQQSPVYISYTAFEHRVASVTQFGRTFAMHYDAEYRLTGFTGPDGHTRSITYNEAGFISELVDDLGRRTQFEYNSEGQRIGSQEFGLDGTFIRSVSQLFDTLGRLSSTDTQSVNAIGSLTSDRLEHEYDVDGRLGSVTNFGSGEQVSVEYNAFGQLASITEPARQAIDLDGNEIQQKITGFEYDAAGNEVAITDARTNRTEYLKDDFGRVVTLNSPDTGITRYRYDEVGNRIEKSNAGGATTTYTWDAANRMTGKQRPDGKYTYTYSSVDGKLIESVAPETTERFNFDKEARLIRHEREIDTRFFVTEYDYDSASRLSVKTLPDGQVLRYHYRDDETGVKRGTLKAITRQTLLGLRQETLIAEIDQDGRDGFGGHRSHNGLMTQVIYGPDGSIVSMNIDQAMQLDYEFDEAGRIIGIDVNGMSQKYRYSGGGLSHADMGETVFRFEYDSTGNRVASSVENQDGSQESTLYTYAEPGAGNQLQHANTLTLDSPSGTPAQSSRSQRFNEQGAPVARDGLTYEYNHEQRPVRVLDNGQLLADYAYNGFGERIRKVTYRGDAKKVTYFLYDGNKLTAEISDENEPMRHAVFLDEAPVAYLIGRDMYAVHSDHIGTPRLATNSDGETVWSADYAPFGKATIVDNKIDLPYRFAGQYHDTETDTHYNYYRDYDPATGRFITSDPIGLQGGLNTYAYALNNPLGLTDPLGLDETGQATTTGESADKPTASEDDTGSYAKKLEIVFNAAYDEIVNTPGSEVAAGLLKSLAENAAVVAAVAVAMLAATAAGYGAVALAIVAAAGWLMAGYEAGKFIVDTLKLALRVNDIKECDEAALKAEGAQLGQSVKGLATELAASALLGGLGKIARAVEDFGSYINDGAFTIYRKIRAILRADDPTTLVCSFAGDTLVVTQNGYTEIENIIAGHDRVWARNEHTGEMGWRDVLAQYSNDYKERVHVTTIDEEGRSQTITSNRIHPYFARLAASALLVSASVTAAPDLATEGNVYTGEIVGGAWVDAQYLQPGDELLSDDGHWQKVAEVEIQDQPLKAYNLTVDEYSTYFVAGHENARAVWVHNKCFEDFPSGFTNTGELTDFGQPIFRNGDDVVYQGHDGRYYDIDDHPPTERLEDAPKFDTVPTSKTEIPADTYSQRPDGMVIGPRGGQYEPIGYDANGYQIYQNGSTYVTFRDGKRVVEPSPRPPTVSAEVGIRGERRVTAEMDAGNWKPMGNTQPKDGDINVAGYQGRQGIDGIYTRDGPNGPEFVIVETKASQSGTAGGLNTMSDNKTMQMSKEWIDARVKSSGLSGDQARALRLALRAGEVKFVKAEVTGVNPNAPEGPTNGTVTFTELKQVGPQGVSTKGSWNP